MLAKKCDRCGKFYESYDMVDNSEMNGVYIISKNKFGVRESISKDIDLCIECMNSFIKWYEMKEIPKEENKSVNPTSEDIIDMCNKIERKFNYEFKYK